MLSNICIYNNKIFFAFDSYLIAYCYKIYPKSQEEQFYECLKVKLPVNCTSVKDVRLEAVNNSVLGLKSLIIFLLDTSGQWKSFIYNNVFRKKLNQLILPNFVEKIEDCSANLFVSDGPNFLFHASDGFHLYSLPYSINNKFDCKFFLSDCKEFKILQFKCFGLFNNYQQFLFLLIVSCNFSSQQNIKILGYVSEKNRSVINVEQLPVNFFFPLAYENILKAVQITKAIPIFKSKFLNVKEIKWKETECVICTKTHCFIFSNAVLQYCCKLSVSLSNIMCMKIEFSNISLENVSVVLAFENKTTFFITIRRNISCEEVKYWTDIEAVVVGDILMKGSKQVLLLKQINLDLWQNNSILFDMSSFMPIDLFSHSSVPDDCLKATISGLERKVQVGRSAIKDIDKEISQKSAATIDALIKLNEFKVNTESLNCSYTFQKSLVNLILSKDENILVKSESPLKLLEEKQRFINNQWIISLCFINEGERSICYPNIKALIKNRQVPFIQKLIICGCDGYLTSIEHGQQINTKTKFYIILSFEFSVAHTENDIFMILSWYNGSTDEFDNEVFINENEKILAQNQLCIQTKMTLRDLLHQLIQNAISSSADLLFTRVLQQKTNLNISSLHSNISKLEDILVKNDPNSQCIYLLENPSTKCIIFNKENNLLFGVHFIIMKSTHNVVEIETFSRKESEICLLIHYLYQHLPDDITITPSLKFSDECTKMKKTIVVFMKSEVDMLMSSFDMHNASEEMTSYAKQMSSQTFGTVTIPKTAYHRIRKELVKKECITDSIFRHVFLMH